MKITFGSAALLLIIMALVGAGSASATELYKYTTPSANDTFGIGSELVASLDTGSSSLLKNTNGYLLNTCTASEAKGKIEVAGGPSSHPIGKLSSLTMSGCSFTTAVLAPGELEVKHIAGSTNGSVISRGARVTFKEPTLGISCVANTNSGTTLGTLTGASTSGGQAIMDINAVITLENGCGDATWTGNYRVTSPTGLIVEAGESPPPPTELYRSTSVSPDTQNAGTEITATLKSGSSLQLKDTNGTSVDTCTGSEIKGKIESAGGSASNPAGNVSAMTFNGCSHTTSVLANGSLEVKSIAGTTNGTVVSKGARITVQLTVLGISCVVNTGEGTTLGSLTSGEAGGQATIDVNAVVPLEGMCGDAALTGTYSVTSPKGLAVEGVGSGSELYQSTPSQDTQGVGTEITATLKSATSLLLKDTLGGGNDTCTGSELKGKIENAGGASSLPAGKVSTLAFSGCSHTTTVLAPGELEIKRIAGTTNGTVISKDLKITVKSTIYGVSCVVNTGVGTTLGTLTGAGPGEQATMHINGVIKLENGCGDSTLTGTYLVTSPTGLVVEGA